MAKLTKQRAEQHHQAEELLRKEMLTLPEREFVLEYWNPGVASNVTRQAAFFTPNELASTFSLFARCGGEHVSYIDLCAGNGRLMRAMIDAHAHDPAAERDSQRYVCVELDPGYVDVGRKCVPEATWLCGDVFDLDFIAGVYAAHGPFTCAISNPPFGSVPTKRNGHWLKFHGPCDLMVAEIACRMAVSADLLLPTSSVPYDSHKREIRATELTRKWEAAVGRRIYPNVSVDVDCYDFEDVKPQIMLASLESLAGDSYLEPLGFDDVIASAPASIALPLFV